MKKPAVKRIISVILVLLFSLTISTVNLAGPGTVNDTLFFAQTIHKDCTPPSWFIEKAASAKATAKAKEIVKSIIKPGMDDFKKAVVLHDWVTENTRYDYNAKNCYIADGPLLDGRAVCAGYAQAYKLLCDQAKLDCKYVGGMVGKVGHGWNMVKMNGKWYHVDCTWDDPPVDTYGKDPKKSGDERHLYFGLTDTAIGFTHSKWTPNYKCDSIADNYYYRKGLLNKQINGCVEIIKDKLISGGVNRFQVTPLTNNQNWDMYRELTNSNVAYHTIATALSAKKWVFQNENINLKIDYHAGVKPYYQITPNKPKITKPVNKLTFVSPPKSIAAGASSQLICKAEPNDATYKIVKWSSSNSNIISVDQSGSVKAKKAGSAVITITATDGSNKTAYFEINVPAPAPATKPTIVQIAAGGNHSLALFSDGSLYAWGDNRFCQLGDGTNISNNKPVLIGTGFTKIAAGGWHSLALKGSSLYAWGYNANGEIGDGTIINKNTPVLIGTGFSQIAAGNYHSLALKGSALYAWGFNQYGQSGDGSNMNKHMPVLIGTGYTQIAARCYYSLALKGNSLYTWGRNGAGELGDGTYINKNTPVLIGTGYTQIAAGGWHALALQNSLLYAWGYNNNGQLGDGTNKSKNTPLYIGTGFTQISAGGDHSFALKGSSLYAWGNNEYGQLGDGTKKSKNTPVLIGSGYTQVAAGWNFTLALKGGSLYVWGKNDYGQLGDGKNTDRNVPAQITFSD